MNLSPKWIPQKFENENSLLLDQVKEFQAVGRRRRLQKQKRRLE